MGYGTGEIRLPEDFAFRVPTPLYPIGNSIATLRRGWPTGRTPRHGIPHHLRKSNHRIYLPVSPQAPPEGGPGAFPPRLIRPGSATAGPKSCIPAPDRA